MPKKVSLILTTYNSEKYLPITLKSIEEQDYPNIEVIIKDGGSSDRTLDIIEDYKSKGTLNILSASCKDTGIYDAMNQGYALSTGDIIAFFNDRFTQKSAISKLVNAIDDNVVGVHADLNYADGDKVVRKWHMGPQKSLYLGWMPGHPTMYLKREIYEKYGLYDTSYRIAADYEFMIRFLKHKENRLAYVPCEVISMYYGGTSTTSLKSYISSLIEGHRAASSNGLHPAWIINFIRTIRVLLQFR